MAVGAVDIYGNVSAPVVVTFSLLTATPPAPTQPALTAGSNTGVDPAANLTDKTSISIQVGTALNMQIQAVLDRRQSRRVRRPQRGDR